MSSGLSLEVIDPLNRTGKIVVPMTYVHETRGVIDFRKDPAKRDGKDLSLCLLHQRGRCRAGERCHQVHADADFVERLRQLAAAGSTCCAAHGDCHSTGYLALAHNDSGNAADEEDDVIVAIVSTTDDGAPAKRYNIVSFGRTQCLDGLLRCRKGRGDEVRVPAGRVCRLHAHARCKFGRDCKNVHLCREAVPLAAPAAAPKGVAPLDVLCGLSDRSSSSAVSKTSSSSSPNDDGLTPLSLEVSMTRGPSLQCATVVVPLPCCSDEPPADAFLSSSCLGSAAPLALSAWSAPTSLPSPAFDGSGFEDTLRSLREEFADL